MSVEPKQKSTRKESIRLLIVGVIAILIGAAGASFTIYTAKTGEKAAQSQAITLAEDKKQSNICQNNPEEPLCKFSDDILKSMNANGVQRGPQGERGPSGKDGQDGIDGKDGVNGKDGKNGIDGIDGSNGPPGLNGSAGDAGTDGSNGLNGTDGAAGQDGAQGPMGPQGPAGPMGPMGPAGPAGIDGSNATMPTQYQWTRNGVVETCVADAPGSSSYTCQTAVTQPPVEPTPTP